MATGPESFEEFSKEELQNLKQLAQDVDQAAEELNSTRRDVIKSLGLLGTGIAAGGISAQQLIEQVSAQASTTDGDGNVGLPSDRVDGYFDGIDGNSASLGSLNAEDINSIKYANAFDGATGAEKINNAIADLPSRGGMVIIPTNGPDDNITNSRGNKENNVWEVDRTINPNDKTGVQLVGNGPGVASNKSGTALICTDSAVGDIIKLGSDYFGSVNNIRIDGADNASAAINLGNGNSSNDFKVVNTLIQNTTQQGIKITGQKNFWIENCWVEVTGQGSVTAGGIETIGSQPQDTLWITNLLTFANQVDIRFNGNNTFRKAFVQNLRAGDIDEHCISLVNTVRDSIFVNNHIDRAGLSSTGSYDAINLSGGMHECTISNTIVQGRSETRHAINRDGGSISDLEIDNLKAFGLTGSNLNNVTNIPNGTRVTINQIGANGGNDPASSGDWSGSPREGVIVKWNDGANDYLSIYTLGSWYQWQVS